MDVLMGPGFDKGKGSKGKSWGTGKGGSCGKGKGAYHVEDENGWNY